MKGYFGLIESDALLQKPVSLGKSLDTYEFQL